MLFCGINPGLYSGAVGHHFARPGNRFWRTLRESGFTPTLLGPFDERELLPLGLGITNLVKPATAGAADLDPAELRAGANRLRRMARRLKPRFVAILGFGAFRTAFDQPDAVVGPQELRLEAARTWVLPNPSGLNAHYQLPALTEEFERLRTAARPRRGSVSRGAER